MIVSIPDVIPPTTPPALTVATALLLLLQAPVPVASVSVIVDPVHTVDAPDIVPAPGTLTRMPFFADTVPHALVTEYNIVSVPALTPVTMPPVETVAFAFWLLQVPPGVPPGSAKVAVLPAHIFDGKPKIVPADGNDLINTVLVAVAVPHAFVTV